MLSVFSRSDKYLSDVGKDGGGESARKSLTVLLILCFLVERKPEFIASDDNFEASSNITVYIWTETGKLFWISLCTEYITVFEDISTDCSTLIQKELCSRIV